MLHHESRRQGVGHRRELGGNGRRRFCPSAIPAAWQPRQFRLAGSLPRQRRRNMTGQQSLRLFDDRHNCLTYLPHPSLFRLHPRHTEQFHAVINILLPRGDVPNGRVLLNHGLRIALWVPQCSQLHSGVDIDLLVLGRVCWQSAIFTQSATMTSAPTFFASARRSAKSESVFAQNSIEAALSGALVSHFVQNSDDTSPFAIRASACAAISALYSSAAWIAYTPCRHD
jgi:hypothetical protein